MTAYEALAWLDTHGTYCLIQQLPPTRRQKNRCLLEFRLPDGQTAACGGRNLFDAVQRAAARIQTFAMRNDLSIPGAETRRIQSSTLSQGLTTRGVLRGRYDA